MMRSFILLEKPGEKRRNRLIILGFIIFTMIISYIVYNSVAYGLSKINISSYNSEDINLGGVKFSHLKTTDVKCGDDNNFMAWVVNNDQDRENGLSIFDQIKDDQAMLFVFDTPNAYSFWMKDMKFPIDIVWLDQNKQIVDVKESIATSTYPGMFTPSAQGLYVLEFNAGTVEKTKIKIGDSCSFGFSPLK